MLGWAAHLTSKEGGGRIVATSYKKNRQKYELSKLPSQKYNINSAKI